MLSAKLLNLFDPIAVISLAEKKQIFTNDSDYTSYEMETREGKNRTAGWMQGGIQCD
jgi:hypothetical protein